MYFNHVLGQEHLKKHLCHTADSGRVPHAQLFVGPEGAGTLPMALAYAQYLLCGKGSAEGNADHSACEAKCASLTHPDLHFVYPVANTPRIKSHAISDDFIGEWRDFIRKKPYGSLFDWYQQLGIEKKQGQIGVDEAQNMVKKLFLKSYEGGKKIMVVWRAEKMNIAASNKLLKLIEEPPDNTVLLFIAEQEDLIINTIRSRCQVLHFQPLSEELIAQKLVLDGTPETKARQLAHEANGNYTKALSLADNATEDAVFGAWFVLWVRAAFKAKGNKAAIHELLAWGDELAKNGRETQKNFLSYCIAMIRQALLLNYGASNLVYAKIHVDSFDLEKFAPFVHENNIQQLVGELEEATYHIERNGNAKLIFTDLSIKMTKLLHLKPN